MTEAKNLTPLMKQYWDIKVLHPDKVLLFRMGDFFEMFHDDAIQAAPLLGIALTQRNKKSQDETPMCGVPHHSIAGPINKLLAKGLKVAICDQVEDPKFAKGLVKRAVTRVLTPGMVYDSDTLALNKPHFMMSFDKNFASFIDTTTGEAFYFEIHDQKKLNSLFEIMDVAEVVLDAEGSILHQQIQSRQQQNFAVSFFDSGSTNNSLPESAQRLLGYIKSLNNNAELKTIRPFEKRPIHQKMKISATTLRHLEVFQNYRGEDSGSLLSVMDKTQTSPGSRKLRSWMMFPLTSLVDIQKRQDQIQFFRDRPQQLKKLRQILFGLGDLERRLTKVSAPQSNARDLRALGAALDQAFQVLTWSLENESPVAYHKTSELQKTKLLADEILKALCEDPPLSTKQGGLIQKFYSSTLDEVIDLATNSQALVEELEQKEKTATGIGSLKIRYNNVFGFYIEVTHTHKEKIPDRYKRKQTLANAERFYTDELIELERKVLSAQSRRNDLEFEVYESLRLKALTQASEILSFSDFISELDVITSLAWLSLENRYSRPDLTSKKNLFIKGARHPVVEHFVGKDYVANDIQVESGQVLLITGPNMAGKSTVLRQVALISLMAQMGSFVPAAECLLPLIDAIYTRIGASDHLTEGLSTFMVEMTETAEMLSEASPQSLIILDEVGRGTSTYDGLSLAQSILEFLVKKIKAPTLFATHYHELTQLEKLGWPILNSHMSVSEKNGEIRFLHDLKKGPAHKSYGIQVAQLAGVPSEVVLRAKEILKQLELGQALVASSQQGPQLDLFSNTVIDETELNLAKKEIEKLKSDLDQLKSTSEQIQKLNLNQMTPIQALQFISEVQNRLQ